MRGWRYRGWLFPGSITWGEACWLIGGSVTGSRWWTWSNHWDRQVESFCIAGFCFERMTAWRKEWADPIYCEMLERLASESAQAKQTLRDAGFGVTGTPLRETVALCLDELNSSRNTPRPAPPRELLTDRR